MKYSTIQRCVILMTYFKIVFQLNRGVVKNPMMMDDDISMHGVILQISGLPLIIHLKVPRLFPDIFSFPYRLTEKKSFFIIYFDDANCITSNLGVILKGKICSPREQILSFKSSPQ